MVSTCSPFEEFEIPKNRPMSFKNAILSIVLSSISVVYDLGYCGCKARGFAIREMAADMLEMGLNPVEVRLRLIELVRSDRVSSTKIVVWSK
jgi:hypothetical protein